MLREKQSVTFSSKCGVKVFGRILSFNSSVVSEVAQVGATEEGVREKMGALYFCIRGAPLDDTFVKVLAFLQV